MCKEAGLTTHAYNIIGIPHETPAAILDTIKLNAAIGVDVTHVSIYQPYPGTRLAEVCQKEQLTGTPNLPLDFCSSSSLKLPGVTPSQVLMFRDYFRVLMRYFQLLRKLPDGPSRILLRSSEYVLSLKPIAVALNLVYPLLSFVYRRVATPKAAGPRTGKTLRRAGNESRRESLSSRGDRKQLLSEERMRR